MRTVDLVRTQTKTVVLYCCRTQVPALRNEKKKSHSSGIEPVTLAVMTPRNLIFTKSDPRDKILVSGSAPPRPNYMESSEYSFSVRKKKELEPLFAKMVLSGSCTTASKLISKFSEFSECFWRRWVMCADLL